MVKCKCKFILYLTASTGLLDSSLEMKAVSFVFMLIFMSSWLSFKLHKSYKSCIFIVTNLLFFLKNIYFPIYHDFNIHCISFSNGFLAYSHSYYEVNNCFTQTDSSPISVLLKSYLISLSVSQRHEYGIWV